MDYYFIEYSELVKKRKSASIASFVIGIIAFLSTWTGLLSFILSIVAINRAKAGAEVPTQPHKTFRVLGKILGIFALLISIFVILVTPIIIILGIITALVGGGAFVVITFGPTLLNSAIDGINNFLTSTIGIDISGIEEIINTIKELIESISNLSSSMGGETALMIL